MIARPVTGMQRVSVPDRAETAVRRLAYRPRAKSLQVLVPDLRSNRDDGLNSHSLRVGMTQDLVADSVETVGILNAGDAHAAGPAPASLLAAATHARYSAQERERGAGSGSRQAVLYRANDRIRPIAKVGGKIRAIARSTTARHVPCAAGANGNVQGRHRSAVATALRRLGGDVDGQNGVVVLGCGFSASRLERASWACSGGHFLSFSR
jgi:hypothetical protein